MIDNDLRIRRLLQEAQDPEVAVIMLDVVLGYGAHPDPASELAPAVQKARQIRAQRGRRAAGGGIGDRHGGRSAGAEPAGESAGAGRRDRV